MNGTIRFQPNPAPFESSETHYFKWNQSCTTSTIFIWETENFNRFQVSPVWYFPWWLSATLSSFVVFKSLYATEQNSFRNFHNLSELALKTTLHHKINAQLEFQFLFPKKQVFPSRNGKHKKHLRNWLITRRILHWLYQFLKLSLYHPQRKKPLLLSQILVVLIQALITYLTLAHCTLSLTISTCYYHLKIRSWFLVCILTRSFCWRNNCIYRI